MRTVRYNGHLSCRAHPPATHPTLRCMPPPTAMHTPCHTCTCYACLPPCMHPSPHMPPSPYMPPTTHALPSHTPTTHTHTLVDRILDTRLWKHYLSAIFPNSLFVYWDSETSIEVTISRMTYSETRVDHFRHVRPISVSAIRPLYSVPAIVVLQSWRINVASVANKLVRSETVEVVVTDLFFLDDPANAISSLSLGKDPVIHREKYSDQWRIQDFPDGWRQPQRGVFGSANVLNR